LTIQTEEEEVTEVAFEVGMATTLDSGKMMEKRMLLLLVQVLPILNWNIRNIEKEEIENIETIETIDTPKEMTSTRELLMKAKRATSSMRRSPTMDIKDFLMLLKEI
jgi:hypothetical protein